jgi:mono/diheme cytochrome c family protein
MSRTSLALVAAALALAGSLPLRAEMASNGARGKYLVTIASCTDCHTPGYFFGKPDMARYLGGSEVGFEIPGLGIFHGPNLTPDKETGLGDWTEEMFIKTMRTGLHQGKGRPILPPMPFFMVGALNDSDIKDLFAYLQSLPPVHNRVPAPIDPTEGK